MSEFWRSMLETFHWFSILNVEFDNWFSTAAANVEDMPNFHADKQSKMFGTSTHNSKPNNDLNKPDQ